MRVLVCGGRGYTAGNRLFAVMDSLHEQYGFTVVIQGGQVSTDPADRRPWKHRTKWGADWFARRWAEDRGVECEQYQAQWRALGKRAGPIRNQRMIDEGRPEMVVAFPGGRGTADMMERAWAAGLRVVEINEAGEVRHGTARHHKSAERGPQAA